MDRDDILAEESRIENLGVDMASWGGEKGRLFPRPVPVRLLGRSLEKEGIQPVLLGESGVGKTATVATLARAMREKDILLCPGRLHGTRIVQTTPSDILSGALYCGQIEHKIKLIARNCVKRDAILFLDNLPSFMGKGSSSVDPDGDIPALLAPFLRHGGLRVICTATPDGWADVCRRHPAFARLLTPLHVPEATREETAAVLSERARGWSEKHGVEFGSDAFDEAIDLADRLFPWKRFPGKACDLVEQTLSFLGQAVSALGDPAGEEPLVLGRADIAELVRSFTRLPGFLLDPFKPASRDMLRGHFRSRLFGQEEIVETLVDRVQMIKARLCEPGRPLAAYLFAGSTGVGKTLAARTLAGLLLGDEKRLVRFDMSEFISHESVSRFIGGEGGSHRRRGGLVDAALTETFPVILLDEIEKAHRCVFDVLLQVLGEGRLTDETGRTASFTNAVILMTSNLGAGRRTIDHPRRVAGEADRARVEEAVRQHFRPEFINRLTGILVFGPLGRREAETVARREVQRLAERKALKSRSIRLALSSETFDRLVEAGYSKEYGARPMERAVESLVGIPLARYLAERPDTNGATLVVGWSEGDSAPSVAEEKSGCEREAGSGTEAQAAADAGDSADEPPASPASDAADLAILRRRAGRQRRYDDQRVEEVESV